MELHSDSISYKNDFSVITLSTYMPVECVIRSLSLNLNIKMRKSLPAKRVVRQQTTRRLKNKQ